MHYNTGQKLKFRLHGHNTADLHCYPSCIILLKMCAFVRAHLRRLHAFFLISGRWGVSVNILEKKKNMYYVTVPKVALDMLHSLLKL